MNRWKLHTGAEMLHREATSRLFASVSWNGSDFYAIPASFSGCFCAAYDEPVRCGSIGVPCSTKECSIRKLCRVTWPRARNVRDVIGATGPACDGFLAGIGQRSIG